MGDEKVMIKDKRNGVEEILWKVDDEVRSTRLPRYTVPMEEQEEFESAKLWRHVSDAIDKEDQHAATEQKSILEEAQRAGARERKANEEAWIPRFFELDASTDQYVYI